MSWGTRQQDSNLYGRWTVSYVDVLTLLLVLFMAISARAIHEGVRNIPRQEVSVQENAGLQWSSSLRSAEEKLRAAGIEPRLETRGLVISLPQTILFPSGSDEIDPAAYPVVEHIAAVLKEIPNRVCLVGHADSVPVRGGRFKSNWELSAARSLRLLELLSGRYGVPEWRLSTAGYGSQQPRDTNETEQGRAANRRVEIVILDEVPNGSPSSEVP